MMYHGHLPRLKLGYHPGPWLGVHAPWLWHMFIPPILVPKVLTPTTADLHRRWALQTSTSPRNIRHCDIQRSDTQSLRSHRLNRCAESPNAFESTLPTKLGIRHKPQQHQHRPDVDLNGTANETRLNFPKIVVRLNHPFIDGIVHETNMYIYI